MGEAELLVVTESLTKRYGQLAALEDCSLEVGSGEVFGLLGPNGAGKTTLIRLLLGFLRPTRGWARIGGFDCYDQSLRVRQATAYLPGEPQLFRTMRGGEVLEFFAGVRPGSRVDAYRRIAERLELDLSRRVSAMSTGMRQKLALAATLAAPTPLLILDEPTANLDPTVRAEVIAIVLEARNSGRTVIFSSHVLPEVEQACDRVAILRSGCLAHIQTMSELRRRHRIHAWFHDPLLDPLNGYAGRCTLVRRDDREVTLEADGELAPLLAWLAHLPLEDIRVEQAGLRAVYDRFHSLAPIRTADS
jgi:ABC-2 type transport system ATP-binding protein